LIKIPTTGDTSRLTSLSALLEESKSQAGFMEFTRFITDKSVQAIDNSALATDEDNAKTTWEILDLPSNFQPFAEDIKSWIIGTEMPRAERK
jgi:hypothetical protein